MIYSWHQKTWDQLVTARNSKQLPHALLITGDTGTGKIAFAKELVKSLLCEHPSETYYACGVCKSCKVYLAGAHPDYRHVVLADDKTQIVVDQIRSLNDFLHQSRSYQGSRVAFISPAESLNINAANSLLKSLEEPADNSVILLVTSQLSVLLPTIKSRCQMLHLPLPSKQVALAWLSQQPIQHEPEALLEMAGGKPLLAITFDEESHFESRSTFARDLSAVINHDKTMIEVSKKWQNFSKQEILDWQINWVQQLIKQHLTTTVDTSTSHPLSLSRRSKIENLWELHDQLIKFRALSHTSLNAQLFVENMLLSWLKL